MNTDLSEITLMQLSDSFFPSGLYTMSNGLETIFDEKRVSSEGDVYDFNILNTSLGVLEFLFPFTPSDNLSVNYSYYNKSRSSEEIIGNNRIRY